MDDPGIIGYFSDNNIERLRRCEIMAEKKGMSVAQIALGWVYSQSFSVFALSSPQTKKQAEDSIKAINIKFTEDEVKWLNLED